jgi:hypothetical protein
MLYSKANLKVAGVASTNPYDGALNGVQFDPDGGTVASDGNALVAVGPVKDGQHFPDVGQLAEPGDDGTVLAPDFVAEVETIIPKDKRLSLQHVAMTVGSDSNKVEFTTIDKSGRVRRIAEYAKRERFPNWRATVKRAKGENPIRVCVGRKALLNVLKTIVDACPDSGDSPIFLEIGGGVVLRAVNKETGQHVVGVATSYNVGDKWMETDAWEAKIEEIAPQKTRRKFE